MSMQEQASTRPQNKFIEYSPDIEAEITRLQTSIEQRLEICRRFPSRWLAIQLLERDETIFHQLQRLEGGASLLAEAQESFARLDSVYGSDADIALTDQRYEWIHQMIQETLDHPLHHRLTISDRMDRIITHRVFGIPIFLAAMWVVFKFTAEVSTPFLNWVDGLISGPITRSVLAVLSGMNLAGTWTESLLVDGVLAGVGGVLVFVPVLMFLYVALAVLEDSGYMARAAFVMDRLMHVLGLHGKSFLPMLVGFGCNVPAIYAVRTLENEKDRILTGLLVPFMSCGARLPVYVLIAAIFFPAQGGALVFAMYALGIVVAILVGLLLKHTLFKEKTASASIMELPPYRLPTLKGIWSHTWARTSAFVRKAWTIILATSVVLWFLMAIPMSENGHFADIDLNDSVFTVVARQIAPMFEPLGFGSWEISGALMTGFVAKEVVVSTLAQTYNAKEAIGDTQTYTLFGEIKIVIASFFQAVVDTFRAIPLIVGIDLFEPEEQVDATGFMAAVKQGFQASSRGHGALAGLAFMVFVLLYTPCVITLAAQRHELGSRWMWFSLGSQFALAWVVSFLVFQGGKLLGWG